MKKFVRAGTKPTLILNSAVGKDRPNKSNIASPAKAGAQFFNELLSEPRLRQEGYFNPLPIRQKRAEHLSGKRIWQYLLCDVLMFQAWLEQEQGD
jgi:hypothetical protein